MLLFFRLVLLALLTVCLAPVAPQTASLVPPSAGAAFQDPAGVDGHPVADAAHRLWQAALYEPDAEQRICGAHRGQRSIAFGADARCGIAGGTPRFHAGAALASPIRHALHPSPVDQHVRLQI